MDKPIKSLTEKIVRKKIKAHYEWFRTEVAGERLTLSRCSLVGINSIVAANLSYARFHTVDLGGIDLSCSSLTNSRLQAVSFKGANLENVSFNHADMYFVDFEGANLSGATFNNCSFKEISFLGANLAGANFFNAIISTGGTTKPIIINNLLITKHENNKIKEWIEITDANRALLGGLYL